MKYHYNLTAAKLQIGKKGARIGTDWNLKTSQKRSFRNWINTINRRSKRPVRSTTKKLNY